MRTATLAMSDLERAITSYFPQIYAGVYQGYRVILRAMPTRLYIEALLADEEATDAVWEAWDSGELTTYAAVCAWWTIVGTSTTAIRSKADNELVFLSKGRY